ncbi:Glyco_hydro_17 domain-containing protein/X8 domain-containing protein [Cephalotus follicularis]|uniref:glucan endo-1,3-beta-D-glucosidase n=1 Tax=Cephalotus follicularis TaxID=3775 RepID=A0A1Q3CW33_CEPFO|nr:Glyco_hydro_17 domain-containing protein/X8 domain-containing protein [Cephalotus follicularis]
MSRGFKLIFAISLLLVFPDLCRGSKIGVCYGRNADDLPTPDKVAQLVQQHNIKYLRIYDSNIQVLKAFANTGVELMIGIPNSDLLPFSQFQSNADTWLKNNILPYYPATKITCITVGAEVTEAPNNISAQVVPAMNNVLMALKKVGLHKRIKVSSTHSLGVLSRSFPPSAGAFSSSHASFLKPLLEFLAENQSPFMIDIYPYYAYRDSPSNVSLDYALFQSSQEVIDPNTGLLYTNMFDAQIDALYFALMALNFRTIKIVVTETGWPSKGSPKETAATPDNAQTYNTNLIRHIINDSGTPAKPGEELDVYIFSLFNENRKPGLESERNWGLFYPDQTSVYNLDFTGKGAVDTKTYANVTSLNETTWCIASTKASEVDLQSALDWACGSGNVDCSAIQPSQTCYEPDTLLSHASFAFNSYYQQNGATDVSCSFGGVGIKVDKNPSYDNCLYMTAGANRTASSNTTAFSTPSSSTKNEAFTWICGCLLTTWLFYLVNIGYALVA